MTVVVTEGEAPMSATILYEHSTSTLIVSGAGLRESHVSYTV